MITYNEFIQRFWEENFVVKCSTLEETAQATNMLLDIGFVHGSSGYSKRIAEGDNEERYMIPFITDRGKIEYYRNYDNCDDWDTVDFVELAELCEYNDEFNVEEFDLDGFLNVW